MVQIIKEINVEVSKPNVFPAIVAKQHDNNSRFIKATLVNDGINIDVDSTFNVTINVTRPDGERRRFNGSVNGDGTVTVPLNAWTLELGGMLQCDISVCSPNSRLTSTSFYVMVEDAACASDETFVTIGGCTAKISSSYNMHLISYNALWGNVVITQFVEPDMAVYISSPKTIENVACGSTITIAVSTNTSPNVTTTGGATVERIQNLSADCYHVIVSAPKQSGSSATINIGS